jgi:hypothetical protein
MNLEEFIERHIGRKVRDGQCAALYRQYIQDVWKLPPLEGLGATGGAEGLFTRYETDVGPASRRHLELIRCSPEMIPQPGDAVIFKAAPKNRFGHVAIFIRVEPDGRRQVFEQDGISVMRGGAGGAKLGFWTTDRVLGWLRKR